MGRGELRRDPSSLCRTRLSPLSTFKIPHALAALDAGVLSGPDQVLRYDGTPLAFPSWQRDHTLASAIRYSVVWYFQRVADGLGPARERAYLVKLGYGNMDPTGKPRQFWIEDSLEISPEEQLGFLVRLYRDDLPLSRASMQTVRQLLVQPRGVVVSAKGEQPFARPWPADAVVSAKTGAGSYDDGFQVRWLVGHVQRGERAWVFVSAQAGKASTQPDAISLAARALREEGVL
jgi:beta-lactamase class D